jgi:transposase-like protein
MDTSGTESAVATPPRRRWRRHSEDFKARVIELARQPNTSVAAVALANGLNANMLRSWVRASEANDKAGKDSGSLRGSGSPAFVQLPMHTPSALPTASPEQAAARVDVEIRRNGSTLRATLPLDSRSAAWLREVME